MEKYRISKHVELLDPAGLPDDGHHFQPGEFILADKSRQQEFLVNETIKYFIDKFAEPKTREEAVAEIAAELHCSPATIESQCTDFFRLLRHRRIVVPEDYEEKDRPSEPLFKAGDTLGTYTITALLSNNQEMEIYRATLTGGDDTLFALKVLNGAHCRHARELEESLSIIRQEYALLQQVKHLPSLCRAYELHLSPRPAYMVLEHISGQSLTGYFRKTPQLQLPDCLAILDQILEGFAGLHQAGLIHGDIHPSNVLIRADKSVKIIDLGMSRHVHPTKDEIMRFGGVEAFMPPERIHRTSLHKYSRGPDVSSDVYQLGVLLFEAFYLQDPFGGFTWEELSRNIKETPPVFPDVSFLGTPVPEGLLAVVRKCLHKKPSGRYPNGGALLRDFRKAAALVPPVPNL
ncbi:serine/threonine-protein kinase [Paraflavisolibacter sp. H34]|uniref:serine/threonine protein kinase n=1 Tax=Huijunlia imazamoxiresistens TaxID=3127457 RepID=UPI00301A0772